MRILVTAAAALTFAAAPLAGQAVSDSAGSVSLTIYNDGRVLVRRALPFQVKRGATTARVALGSIDPATLFPLDAGVTLNGFEYDAAVDQQSALRRALGHKLRFVHERAMGPADTVVATVLSLDPLQLGLADGSVIFTMPGMPLYPTDLVSSRATAQLKLSSAAAHDSLRLGYFTEGANWSAAYEVVLGQKTAQISGKAVLASDGLEATNATVQLLAGSVSRAAPPRAPAPMMSKARAEAAFDATAAEQRVGEFHLYSLPGRLTIHPGQTTATALFDPATVSYQRKYVVPGELPIWGPLMQHIGDQNEVPVEVTYVVPRKRGTDFGDRPLPMGVVRLYQADSAGAVQLVGEAGIGHTPAGKELRLFAGNAFDITAERVQTEFHTQRDSTRGTWRTIATAGYRVTITNATDTAVAVEVREERRGDWKITSSSVPAEKVSSSVARFTVPVPARGEAVLRYTVQASW